MEMIFKNAVFQTCFMTSLKWYANSVVIVRIRFVITDTYLFHDLKNAEKKSALKWLNNWGIFLEEYKGIGVG